MTSKCDKNKEVCYKPHVSSITDNWTCFDTLCVLTGNTSMAKWHLFPSYIVLISIIPHKTRNVFKNLQWWFCACSTLQLIISFVYYVFTLITFNSPRQFNQNTVFTLSIVHILHTYRIQEQSIWHILSPKPAAQQSTSLQWCTKMKLPWQFP